MFVRVLLTLALVASGSGISHVITWLIPGDLGALHLFAGATWGILTGYLLLGLNAYGREDCWSWPLDVAEYALKRLKRVK